MFTLRLPKVSLTDCIDTLRQLPERFAEFERKTGLVFAPEYRKDRVINPYNYPQRVHVPTPKKNDNIRTFDYQETKTKRKVIKFEVSSDLEWNATQSSVYNDRSATLNEFDHSAISFNNDLPKSDKRRRCAIDLEKYELIKEEWAKGEHMTATEIAKVFKGRSGYSKSTIQNYLRLINEAYRLRKKAEKGK
ncbi:MAG: hypothetical protein ACPGXZ_06595 [Saprospiraceae bacterium]